MGAYGTRLVRRYVRFAHAHGFTPVARLSVIPLPMVAPLPPSISLQTPREVFWALTQPGSFASSLLLLPIASCLLPTAYPPYFS